MAGYQAFFTDIKAHPLMYGLIFSLTMSVLVAIGVALLVHFLRHRQVPSLSSHAEPSEKETPLNLRDPWCVVTHDKTIFDQRKAAYEEIEKQLRGSQDPLSIVHQGQGRWETVLKLSLNHANQWLYGLYTVYKEKYPETQKSSIRLTGEENDLQLRFSQQISKVHSQLIEWVGNNDYVAFYQWFKDHNRGAFSMVLDLTMDRNEMGGAHDQRKARWRALAEIHPQYSSEGEEGVWTKVMASLAKALEGYKTHWQVCLKRLKKYIGAHAHEIHDEKLRWTSEADWVDPVKAAQMLESQCFALPPSESYDDGALTDKETQMRQ